MFTRYSPIPQWFSDPESGTIVEANSAALRFWGYSREQFIGLDATRLLAAAELPKQKKLAKANVWGETGPWQCERADGSQAFVKLRWQKISYGDRLYDFAFVTEAGVTQETLTPLQ